MVLIILRIPIVAALQDIGMSSTSGFSPFAEMTLDGRSIRKDNINRTGHHVLTPQTSTGHAVKIIMHTNCKLEFDFCVAQLKVCPYLDHIYLYWVAWWMSGYSLVALVCT